MVIIRRPRQFPPIPSNKEIIEKATTNNVIDLSKIRDIKFAIKSKVRERISKATKTKLRKKEIVDYFSKIYTKYMDGEYVFRKNHFMSYRDKNGSLKRVKVKSDKMRIWNCFLRLYNVYGIEEKEFNEYLLYIMEQAIVNGKVRKIGQLVSFITLETNTDEYFYDRKKRKIFTEKREESISRSKEHSRYFNE